MLMFYKDTRNTEIVKCINNAQPEPEPCYKNTAPEPKPCLRKQSSGDGAGANLFLQELSSPDRKEIFPSKEWNTEQSVYFAS